MEIAHILDELAFDMHEIPREAIEAAISKQEQITPYLLKILKDAYHCIDEIIENDSYQGHLYAMYLLAQFREIQAYPLIVNLISLPGDLPHAIVGDVLTEDLGRILASVCGSNLEPLERLIENTTVNEYVRMAAQSGLIILVGCGITPRQSVISYFHHLFSSLERKPSIIWTHLISCCCDLFPDELAQEILQAYAEGLVSPQWISLEEVEEILSQKKEDHLHKLYHNSELIEDTVVEMEKWLHSLSEYPATLI